MGASSSRSEFEQRSGAGRDGGHDHEFSATAEPEHTGFEEATSPSVPSAATTEAPVWIGKYLVLEAVDEGGQGQVFRVLHPELKKDFALKIIPSRTLADPAERKRLVDEARKQSGCEHPNLLRVIDLDFHEGRPFVVMEYVRGPHLERYRVQTPPNFRTTARLVAELAGAVAYIHEQGLVHQDIKPKNVLVDGKGRARLIDFGLARSSHAWSDDSDQSVGGTAGYMSPEQARGIGDCIGPATDIFGLGGVLFYLLAGRPVYEGPSRSTVLEQATKAEQVRPRLVNPRVPRRLERICMMALAADPARRYGSASDFERDLRRFLRRPRMVGAGVLALAAATLAFAAFQAWPDRAEAPRIASFGIKHFRGDNPPQDLGTIGESTAAILFDDDVRVRAELSAPAYCYLLALNPDGKIQLCHPATPTEPPPRSDKIAYPVDDQYFPLTDGVGLQVFLLLASRQPLPAFDDWGGRRGLRWEPAHGESTGVWRFDGQTIEPLTRKDRGQPRKRSGEPRPFKEVCNYIAKIPKIDAVEGVAFPVMAKR